MTNPEILITGATGITGRAAIDNLLRLGHPVKAFVHREDERSEALRTLGVTISVGDLDDFRAVRNALKGVRKAYFCYPISKGLVQASAQFAQAAKENGVEAIVNMSQKIAREDAASHASFEHWLSERVLDWSGIATTHLRPPFFAEWMLLFSPMIRQGQVYAPFAHGKTAFIAGEDQGRVIARILENPVQHRGKTYYLYGPEELTFQNAIERSGRALGKWIGYHVTPFEVMQQNIMQNSKKDGRNNALNGYAESNQPVDNMEPHLFQHLRSAHQDFENGLFAGMNDEVEAITGTPPISIEQFVSKHRAAFE